MLNNKPPDATAFKILKRYDELTQSYFENGCKDKTIAGFVKDKPTTREDLSKLVDAGIGFSVISMTHDEAVHNCFSAFHSESIARCVRQFVAGLGKARPDLRSGLSAFAMMQSMPIHSYRANRAGFCEICSGPENRQEFDLTTLSQNRHFVGALTMARTPYEIQFYLMQQAKLDDEKPDTADIEDLKKILNTARTAAQDCTPTKLQKFIREIPGLKLDTSQAIALIETLGICGILQTDEHRGYLERWTNPGLSPHKTHSSDWAYPVDFWTGKNGVNEKAVDFWFGSILN